MLDNAYIINEQTLNNLAKIVQVITGKEQSLTPDEMIQALIDEVTIQRNFYDHVDASELVELTNPYITAIGYRHFRSSPYLSKISCKNLETIRTEALLSCDSIIEINAPKLRTIEVGGLYGVSNITRLDLPSLTTCGHNSFREMDGLVETHFPSLETVGTYAWRDCVALTEIELPAMKAFGAYPFEGCTSLKALILSNPNTVCTLPNRLFNASETPPDSFEGIYVPDDLVNAYKTNTNWTVWSDYIKPLSERNSAV